jgi:beta-lactamase superfamily II metal-dependent hydrolase
VHSQHPASHEFEISVFGPGIGECVVAHVGDGDWIVVDSCLDKQVREPIALQYLKSLGVDVSSRVRMVLATHWHDDHIKGIGKVFAAAEGATFVDSAAYAYNRQLLARVVRLGSTVGANATATQEYSSIYETLQTRRKKGENKDAVGPLHAIANRKLLSLSDDVRTVSAEIVALSPSDGTLNRAETELRQALSAIEDRKRPASGQGPNQLCVALWLKVGAVQAMLGADLEHIPGVTEGWKAIIASEERPEGQAGILKVPHHGSKNADCPECWTELLSEAPVAVVTPYSPARLPGADDLRRLCERTKHVYLTGDQTQYKVARLNHTVAKTLRESKVKRRALEGMMGHVRIRVDAREAGQTPEIELSNGAEKSCA